MTTSAAANQVDVTPPTPSKRATSGTFLTGLLVVAALLGVAVAHVFHLHQVYDSTGYLYAVTALLAIGIYSSTSGIDVTQLRNAVRTVMLAITVGVVVKSLMIAIIVLPLLHDPIIAIILGVAVAQIDPLAVAALVGRSRLSDSGKAVLRAWSAFDDPVTMLLTIYLLALLPHSGADRLIGAAASNVRFIGLAVSIGENLLFAGVLFALWAVARRLRRYEWFATLARSKYGSTAAALILLAAGFVAVTHFLLFGLALTGLFLRPAAQELLDRLAEIALGLAAVALGIVLAGGVWWLAGVLLGLGAYVAQLLVAPIVAYRQPGDRVLLGLAQQNGITAITLALLVQPFYSQAVAIIGPAVLVVNLLHAGANGAWNLIADRRTRPDRDPWLQVSPARTAVRPAEPARSDSRAVPSS